jgi:hypothetical protein
MHGDGQSIGPHRSGLKLDLGKYLALLEDSGMSEAEKTELIELLWPVIVTLVDLGIGIDPTQQACGQLDDFAAEFTAATHNVLGSDDTNTTTFAKAAGGAAKRNTS